MGLLDYLFKKQSPIVGIKDVILRFKDMGEEVEEFEKERSQDVEKVKELIKVAELEGRNIDETSEPVLVYGSTAFNNALYRRYQIALLLLEAGANPHAPPKPSAFCKSRPIERCLSQLRLPHIRLLLWFGPEYKTIPLSELYQEKGGKTVAEWIGRWDHQLTQRGKAPVGELLERTAQDSKAVTKLIAEAEQLLRRQEYLQTALCYQKIAHIYDCQLEIERNLKLENYSYFDNFPYRMEVGAKQLQNLRKVSLPFYRNKAFLFYQKAHQFFQQAAEHCKEAIVQYSPQHLKVVERLLVLAKEIGAEGNKEVLEQIPQFAKVAAELQVALNPIPSEDLRRYRPSLAPTPPKGSPEKSSLLMEAIENTSKAFDMVRQNEQKTLREGVEQENAVHDEKTDDTMPLLCKGWTPMLDNYEGQSLEKDRAKTSISSTGIRHLGLYRKA